jgi:CBS domain-containing protein
MANLNVGSTPISELVEDEVLRISPDASLEDVAEALTKGNVGALAVCKGDRVLGVVSERDVVRAVAQHDDLRDKRAIDVANRTLVWCDIDSTIAEVAAEMMDRYVRHVLVEEDGRLAGVASARDLLGAYATEDMEPD